MGKAKIGVSAERRADAEHLETEIAAIRAEIDETLGELDRRRREVMDVRLQLARHALPLIAAAAAGGAVLVGAALLAYQRRQNAHRPIVKVRRARVAALRALDHPERVARPEPALHMKLLTATLTALAGATAKRLVERAISPSRKVVVPVEPLEKHAFEPQAHA